MLWIIPAICIISYCFPRYNQIHMLPGTLSPPLTLSMRLKKDNIFLAPLSIMSGGGNSRQLFRKFKPLRVRTRPREEQIQDTTL